MKIQRKSKHKVGRKEVGVGGSRKALFVGVGGGGEEHLVILLRKTKPGNKEAYEKGANIIWTEKQIRRAL